MDFDRFGSREPPTRTRIGRLKYDTRNKAQQKAEALGLSGTHSHKMQGMNNGERFYMPGTNHKKLNKALRERGMRPTPMPGEGGMGGMGGGSSMMGVDSMGSMGGGSSMMGMSDDSDRSMPFGDRDDDRDRMSAFDRMRDDDDRDRNRGTGVGDLAVGAVGLGLGLGAFGALTGDDGGDGGDAGDAGGDIGGFYE